jgi:hypothetical protein
MRADFEASPAFEDDVQPTVPGNPYRPNRRSQKGQHRSETLRFASIEDVFRTPPTEHEGLLDHDLAPASGRIRLEQIETDLVVD